ncbi:MAG TPA: FMN-binding glutamate synthase family protein [Gammaproteobacteria bacterium]|uniref:FMN-binding glutamate synthase family protein n=1 Tax=Immundisolibacter sp. TaxID=1934948 RepID=UPI000E81B82C|nr:FMN-binding glutamate synthase family protein [Gammaproteobacteria bacterium]HCZ49196.1 FMN-binding glutamate synthase family protein [Gammaproteobacteria bacterium]MCH78634.1 FMN-binding glutamate synthase family protein [Gammaproteobacteria bacterium]
MPILPENFSRWLVAVLEILAALFVFALGALVLTALVMYVSDRVQTRHTVRRNFPLIGRFRYAFERLGEFFRQYFFAMDREELPFNRAQRSWVYRAAKNIDNTVAFGSTQDIHRPGAIIFASSLFAPLDQEAQPAKPVTLGPFCRQPYTTRAILNVSAMSYGALSQPAVLALSMGAARAGCWLNTGEGGLAPAHLSGGCDVVFQIGTAKYGVREADGGLSETRLRELAALEQVKMFEIKLSQGAKPGKGGILPAAKVTAEIAAIRGIPEGEDSISPNRHPDIDDLDDLLDQIARIRELTGKPVGFKTVIGSLDWLDDLCAEVRRRGVESAPDFITVDSAEGGSGAAPMPLMDGVGMLLSESLPGVVDRLVAWDLRDRIKVVASGKLINPRGVAWALAVGADFVNSARGFMFALGCIQAMQCNKNTCPTGVTTHDPRLQRGLVPADKAQRVAHFVTNMEKEVAMIAHSCGVSEPRQLSRRHARMMVGQGRSIGLDELYPQPLPRQL